MKAAEATDSLRANSKIAGKFTDDLPCKARHPSLDSWPVLSDKNVKRGRQPINCAGSTPLCKLPTPLADDKNGSMHPWTQLADVSHSDSDTLFHVDHMLMNAAQTGVIRSKCTAPIASVGSMERRRRCSCSNNIVHSSDMNSSCNCNMENCAWISSSCEEGSHTDRAPSKSLSWRCSSDQSSTNAALHRALAAMKKVSGEPDAVKKPQQKSTIHSRLDRNYSHAPPPCEIEPNARSITNSDARTLSMRERGRWGNSKMQQQLFAGSTAAQGGGQNVKPSLSSDHHPQQLYHHHQQALQHVQCLHCGSFSTTPVSGGAKGARSHSFGRRVRDYSWQQELLQEQKRPEQQTKEVTIGSGAGRPPSQSGRQATQSGGTAMQHHQCEYARCADVFPEYEPASAAAMKMHHQGGIMSWQERYMLLCQAIAAGAFVDSGADDSSGPLMAPSRGYSWAVCECATCEMGSARSFRGAQQGFSNTSSGERMMELEAFSGPLGYVSESKGAELSSIMEKRSARRGGSRWWARLPSFGKAKNSPQVVGGRAAAAAAGQNTAQCSSCGQRVWTNSRGEEEGGKLCPDCHGRGAGGASGPIPPPTTRATPTSGARPRPHQPPLFNNFAAHNKNLPRRWRLMKLCRYLMGFPLQR